MQRRQFLTGLPLAVAIRSVTSTHLSNVVDTHRGLTIRFVGMMALVERSDRSVLVALPGRSSQHRLGHRAFLMARAGSPIAAALGLRRAPSVHPAAFDMRLDGTLPDSFVYRCLGRTRLEVSAGDRAVLNRATQPAQLHSIIAGARVRQDIEYWASSVVSLAGGQLADAAAHPDAGLIWSFGGHSQRLTDAVDYTASGPMAIQLTQGTMVTQYTADSDESDELWIVSAAVLQAPLGSPGRLEHSYVAFEFLGNGQAVVAECPDARGRVVSFSDLPCDDASLASIAGFGATRRFPPFTQLCYIVFIPYRT